MQTDPSAASVVVALVEPVPDAIPVATAFAVSVIANNGAAAEGRSTSLTVSGPSGTHRVVTAADGTASIPLVAPDSVGEHAWIIAPAQSAATAAATEQQPLRIVVRTVPVETSMAVWDVPDPVTAGERVTLTVGVKSAGGHALHGQSVEVIDPRGIVVARAPLSEQPSPGTQALYWATLEMTAPMSCGPQEWTARFEAAGAGLAHASSSCPFRFQTVEPAPHAVTVTVCDTAGVPVPDVAIRLGFRRGMTDASGSATLQASHGPQPLVLWHAGYAPHQQSVDVAGDMTLRIAIEAVAEEDPDARWKA